MLCINPGVCNYFPGRIFRQTPHLHVGLVPGSAHNSPASHSPQSSLQPCPQASPSFFGRSTIIGKVFERGFTSCDIRKTKFQT